MTLTTPSLSLHSSNGHSLSHGTVEPAELLEDYHSTLATHWANSLKNQIGSGYSVLPVGELHETCGECISAYHQLLAEEDDEPLWQFIEKICQLRSSQQFRPSEITEAIMLFLESAETVLGPMIPDRYDWSELMRSMRFCTRMALRALADTYLLQLDMM